MAKRGSVLARSPRGTHPSKPSETKILEASRSTRSFHLKPSSSSRRNFKAACIPPTSSDDNNNLKSGPATDEDVQCNDCHATEHKTTSATKDQVNHVQLDIAQRQAVKMLTKITKRFARNHQKYDLFRDNISGKDKRIDDLQASIKDLACQTAGLEELCNSDIDADTLNKLFMAIPFQQRQLYRE